MLTIKIEIINNESLIEMHLDKNLSAKKCFEIQRKLKSIGDEIVERGIKNDVKKYFKKGK